ncbi:MAG TPA: hypothetical protein VFC41_01455, partial [Anaerovoracaceae bacterium]|nr:hypothetical protein [Anaerovoracaceae bacterium]
DQDDFYDISKLLFKNGILKIVLNKNEDLTYNLMDKIYGGMDGDFHEFLYSNASKICVHEELPPNADRYIKKSSAIEYSNKDLMHLMDTMRHQSEEEYITKDLNRYIEMHPEEIHPSFEYTQDDIKKVASIFYSHSEKSDPRVRYAFEWKNKNLLIKNSVSSAILTSKSELAYYNYKLNNFRDKDANYYIEGVRTCMPFVRRGTINEFSFDDILQIRKNGKWKKAMERLGEICNNVKHEIETEQFKNEIKNELIFDYQDSLEEYAPTKTDLLKVAGKNILWTGISFVPLVGPPLSVAGSGADLVGSYLRDRNKQKNLAFFLMDIKKM